jgi:multidrug efflux system membrane fusion protein
MKHFYVAVPRRWEHQTEDQAARDYWASSVICPILFAFTTVAGCSTNSPNAPPPPPVKVTVATAVEQEIIDYDHFLGRTEASETVEVRSRVSGIMKSADFQDGSRVVKGQLLFKIEPDLYQAIHQQSVSRIELWKSKKELAESKLARSNILLPKGAITKEEHDETVAAVREAGTAVVAAIADADRTALDVAHTQIQAEISGRIDRALVTPGNMVTGGLGSGTLLTRIVNNDPVYAYIDIDEASVLKYLRRMNTSSVASSVPKAEGTSSLGEEENRSRLDQAEIPCYMQLADEKDFPHVGKIDFVENRVDSATGSIQVRGVFANSDLMLTGGLFVRIRIPVSKPYRAVLIPEQAIGTDQNIKFAYIIGPDNIPQRKNLELGVQRGGMRVVKSGIEANQKVIYRGLQRVRPGKAVESELVEISNPSADLGNNAAAVVTSSSLNEATASPVAKSKP